MVFVNGQLVEKIENVPTNEVSILEVVNLTATPVCDYKIVSTYRDIFMIINMIDDYVSVLEQMEEQKNVHSQYMIEQFKRISHSLTEQIQLDKEKMYKKCHSKKQDEPIGEDSFTQLFKK